MGLNPYLLELASGRIKKADVPPTPMSLGTPPAPPMAAPPPTNAAPMPAQAPVTMGGATGNVAGQVNQAGPPVTTSQGATNMPGPTQGAAQKAVGLMGQSQPQK